MATVAQNRTGKLEAQHDIPALLEMAGAKPRGNRHDCPECGGSRTISHTSECFFCHKCQWKGNVITLSKELGVRRRLSRAEYQELREKRDQAHKAALRLCAAVNRHQAGLLDWLHTLNRLEARVRKDGPGREVTWESLSLVHAERPNILVELTIVENASARDLIRFFLASERTRRAAARRVMEHGGFYPRPGEFTEIHI